VSTTNARGYVIITYRVPSSARREAVRTTSRVRTTDDVVEAGSGTVEKGVQEAER
jgi:hypothetical protein